MWGEAGGIYAEAAGLTPSISFLVSPLKVKAKEYLKTSS